MTQINFDPAAYWKAIVGDHLNVFAITVLGDFDHIFQIS
jgi:hypothetical protein